MCHNPGGRHGQQQRAEGQQASVTLHTTLGKNTGTLRLGRWPGAAAQWIQ